MKVSRFIVVGENIHCTRAFKVGGANVQSSDGGKTFAIAYKAAGTARSLPVPDAFLAGADWQAGKVKHCCVAIWQAQHGNAAARQAGVDYLQNMARVQQKLGAAYLDINIDEFSTDIEERIRTMKWTVGIVQQASRLPVSVDSSNTAIIETGLEAADPGCGQPMVNSVSLERADAIAVAARHHAAVIASAAGEKGLPSTTEERIANLDRLMPRLAAAGFRHGDIHIDPLVFPISTDSLNGRNFLETVSQVRKKFGADIHISAGLSNVSFGMPSRKLINQVFSYLAVEAGADGGIVDPTQINRDILNGLDTSSKPFALARALLLGEDEFGMNFIAASRAGTI